MSKKTMEQRLSRLEDDVKKLRDWHNEREGVAAIMGIANRVHNRLFDLGPDKVDLRLIAKLNVALGIDVMPLSNKAPKAARKYATAGVKKKKP